MENGQVHIPAPGKVVPSSDFDQVGLGPNTNSCRKQKTLMCLYEYINPKAVHGLMGVEVKSGIESNGLGVETHACL